MKFLGLTLLTFLWGCSGSATRATDSSGTGGADATGGTTGTGGRSATGGSPAADAAPPAADAASDAIIAPDGALPADLAAIADTVVADAPPPLPACPKASVDHLEIWTAHGGSLRPPTGSNLLIKDGDRHYMKVEFLPGSQWHEAVVPVANSLSRKADLSASKGFTITYSATADVWLQLRPLTHPHGGEQHTFKLPATGGMVQDLFVPFAPEAWGMLLGNPTFPFAEAVREANFFNFIAPPASANVIVVRGLRFDGYVPSCT